MCACLNICMNEGGGGCEVCMCVCVCVCVRA